MVGRDLRAVFHDIKVESREARAEGLRIDQPGDQVTAQGRHIQIPGNRALVFAQPNRSRRIERTLRRCAEHRRIYTAKGGIEVVVGAQDRRDEARRR